MGFLTELDYRAQIKSEIKSVVAGTEANALEVAEMAAQAEMESYLNNRYNVPAIFSAENNQRNAVLVMYLVDMVLYHLHSRTASRLIPEIRSIRYDTAKTWLESVMKGELSPNLPLKTNEAGEAASYGFKMGSNDKYSQSW